MNHFNGSQRPNWRQYQQRLKSPAKGKSVRRFILCATIGGLTLLSLYLGLSLPGVTNTGLAAVVVASLPPAETLLSKKEVQVLLNQVDLNAVLSNSIVLPFKDQRLNVETSLDLDLQNHLSNAMDRKNSRFIGIVAMEAQSGKILALAGFDKTDPQANPCLNNEFPAASLFKIVTAAAAVDQCNYTAGTTLYFNGFKHTLYKSQLKETNNHFSHAITFADSFAQSVNSIFGKIGTLHLGKQVLEEYGVGFGFNQPLDFELPVHPSRLTVGDTPYQWAEIASGFNNDTTLSPLHAAMIVSAVLNKGRMAAPTLVERVLDSNGQVLYTCQPALERRAMTSKASAVLSDLMESTVTSGTARKLFKIEKRDQVLSRLRIGGKTGSIANRDHDARFDWFAGFAEEKNGTGRLVVAVLVAHEEYIGTRACTYARMAMAHYFQNHLARHETKSAKSNS